MNTMIPMYVYTTNFISDRVEVIKGHYTDRDRGANLVEYAGLIVLAAIILGLVYGAINAASLKDNLTKVMSHILSGKGQG